MLKVVIGSKNPVKIKAVKRGFKKMYPNDKFNFINVSVLSGVSNQPKNNYETFLGAKNRAINASKIIRNADFHVGIEGGIDFFNNDIEAFAWVVIKSQNKFGKAKTGSFFLPKKISRLVKKGIELGDANDVIFNLKILNKKNGTIGLLTSDVIDRTKYYTEAIILALIPFKNKNFY